MTKKNQTKAVIPSPTIIKKKIPSTIVRKNVYFFIIQIDELLNELKLKHPEVLDNVKNAYKELVNGAGSFYSLQQI